MFYAATVNVVLVSTSCCAAWCSSQPQVCVEWWTFECLILMAGWLPHPQVTLAAAGIGINTVSEVQRLWNFGTGTILHF